MQNRSAILLASVLLISAGPSFAAELPVSAAPMTSAAPEPRWAGLFDLKLVLREDQGLARALLDAGVNGRDASAAAQAIAGQPVQRNGACSLTLALSRSTDGTDFGLQRLVLWGSSGQMIIERRHGVLTVVENGATRSRPAPII